MVTHIGVPQETTTMPGESMYCDARIRYWEEEWISQLLDEAMRLKGKRPAEETRPRKH
jgi:hypothetical protein